ncbi:MAG: hypothetical protein HPY51_20600 [Candidatus Omnitrophica bacterium]|nr:hypothetical protein [Candidatus Omnitrophota bacterium]HPP00595.1 hypothetical protein [bacterium]
MSQRFVGWMAVLVLSAGSAMAQPVHVDLNTLFDTDVVLEPGGAGLGDALDAQGRRVDAGTLPAAYQDGQPVVTQDGRASFLFGPLKQPSLDGLAVNGQTLDVPDGPYGSVDMALLSAPGGYGSPFTALQFHYADGSVESQRFGPVPGWFQSPTAYDHAYYAVSDDSNVNTLISFATNFGDEEAYYLAQERGNGNSGGNRFVDGTGYVLYELRDLEGVTEATLGITVGNNFVISIATDYYDPEWSTTEGYEVLANSMVLYDNFEHRALGNLKQYTFDLAPYLARNNGTIFILFTDATPSNGWGPYIQNITVFTGQYREFGEVLSPAVDTQDASVYAMFLTDGGADEKPYLYDNSGSGPSNRHHRFADGSGSITYKFDLPDEVTDAKLTVDMANNFVVSLGGPTGVTRYAQMSPGTVEEKTFLLEESGSILSGNARFADAASYMIYQFDLPDEVTAAFAQINVGNQFVIEIAAGPEGEYRLEKDYVAETGHEIRDNTNLDTYNFDLAPYLTNNPQKIVRIRLTDGLPADGWGPYLTGIAIVNKIPSEEEGGFQEVLDSMSLYGEDIRNEYNKGYYTIDLSPVLQNNPSKEVFVKFTDGSTGDGWGPGIFWMAVYRGTIDIQSDRLVFNNLKTTTGEPANYGLNLLHRRYALDAGKTLTQIVLPSNANAVRLLGVTLNPGAAAVSSWMIQ